MAGHIHAELMAQYAEDAKVSETPWEFWEFYDHIEWSSLYRSPRWGTNTKYRRKTRTIRIGEFDVPEPLRVAPIVGTHYYIPHIFSTSAPYIRLRWKDDVSCSGYLALGIVHLTEEAATLHAKALLSLTAKQST